MVQWARSHRDVITPGLGIAAARASDGKEYSVCPGNGVLVRRTLVRAGSPITEVPRPASDIARRLVSEVNR